MKKNKLILFINSFFPITQVWYCIIIVCVIYYTLDTHEKQICNALANVVAVALACPDQTTHLWYHIFSPDELIGTYVTGFLV